MGKNKIKNSPEKAKQKSSTMIRVAAAAIILAVSIAYASVYQADFVNLDDHEYVQKNERIQDLNSTNIIRLFTNPIGDMYIPIVYLSYALEYHFSELDPHRYHADNVLLHIINCLLVLWLVWLLTDNIFISVSISGLFALHPLHVESVAWIAERKDVLYALFFMASIISYHFYTQKNHRKYYILSLFFFLLSCMSKPMSVTLPAVLLLYDFFYLKQRSWKIITNKIPFFIFSVVFAFATFRMMNVDVTLKNEFTTNYALFDRTIMILHSVCFYIQKTVFPMPLSAMYIYPKKTGALLPVYYIISAAATLLILWFVFFTKYSNDIIKACFLFFLVTLLPVLQFFANTYTVTADRYSYIPMLGLLGIIVYFTNKALQKNKISTTAAWTGMVILLIILSFATSARNNVWKNSLSLYSDIIDKGQYTEAAITSLGDAYMDNGDYAQGLTILSKADSIYPNKSAVKNRYAYALSAAGQYNKAIEQYLNCLSLDSSTIGTYINLGDAYLKTGKTDHALAVFLKGLSLYPNDNMCLYNAGFAYWSMNNRDESIKYFRKSAAQNFQPAINFLQSKKIDVK